MEIQEYFKQSLKLYETIVRYLTCEEESDINSESSNESDHLNDIFILISQEGGGIQELLLIISKIAENCHRTHNFFDKIFKILLHYISDIKQNFTQSELVNIFQNNEQILIFLFEQKILKPDKSFNQFVYDTTGTDSENKRRFNYRYIFYPETKSMLTEQECQTLEEEISKYTQGYSEVFEKKRKIGENDHYLCEMIRNDSIELFDKHVNQTNIKLTSKIEPSIFETNAFLIENEPTIIEYAAFFGSMHIIKYLIFNKVEMNPSIWLYAIHSNNAEMIHILEENHVSPVESITDNSDEEYRGILNESIKCHHNSIASYLMDNCIKDKEKLFIVGNEINNNSLSLCFECRNYYLLEDNILSPYAFYYLCGFGYYQFVKIYLKYGNLNLNQPFVSTSFFIYPIPTQYFQ